MARLSVHPQTFVGANLTATKRWVTSLGIWGVGAGATALLFLSVTPLVRRELLEKTPLLGLYYKDTTPASDKPF
ncbi:hypothetical protein M413DRAFT_438452 [Hebeloma cylindrosporum]|uniref:Uncharacterized protein n=1 Tax=Hebeloma cylindrosporum TaxID=76867 RepID=A0A0C3CYN1_HEBCY|nr:hypothetical protein M413DRAFT_438452 [Hebeloma cylindrosporum h7]